MLKTSDEEILNSLSRGLSLFQEGKSVSNDSLKLEAHTEVPKEEPGREAPSVSSETRTRTTVPEKKGEQEALASTVKDGDSSNPAPTVPEPPPDNEFEKRIRPEVIPASEIGVTFADIGAMEETKKSLQELVMLPLRRPDLFK
ncbi:Homeobox-like protein [Heracleum sosnowskyi]|uniref:Homeobox-like protein n=1 Tax=Heracleum sosnowskyi TaxID=360622 RepID=A0AAD8I9H4_9APIA|nr:Homeobox-like protein [Heracleum sosnowskyi]